MTDKFLTGEHRLIRQHTLIKTISCSCKFISDYFMFKWTHYVVSAHKSVCRMECRCSLICPGIYSYRMNRASWITIIKTGIDYNKESLPSPPLPCPPFPWVKPKIEKSKYYNYSWNKLLNNRSNSLNSMYNHPTFIIHVFGLLPNACKVFYCGRVITISGLFIVRLHICDWSTCKIGNFTVTAPNHSAVGGK